MARRIDNTRTMSSSETKRPLQGEARIANEARRQSALEWLLEGTKPMSNAERDALLAEIDGRRPPKMRRR